MGLAASQGRYLCLTARMNDLVYEGQQISQQRLALASETKAVADAYNDAISNTVMQVILPDVPDGGNQQLTYDIITSQDPFQGLCMRIVDANGSVVVPKEENYIEVSSTEDGKEVMKRYDTTQDFISTFMPDLGDEKTKELENKPLSAVYDYYKENFKDENNKVEYHTNINYALRNDGESFLYDENVTDPKYLQEMLTTGQWFLEQLTTGNEKGWESFQWQGSRMISEVYDTTDDAAAEAKYESEMADIQRRDKLLELRLEEVQTQESAVEKELESVKQTIDKNVEDSFKTFA